MERPIIRADQVEKFYAQPRENRIQVIAPTDLSIGKGQIVALLGPSGSGKSTLLRMLTGLSLPSAGHVFWHDQPMAQADVNVSIVFQSFALFPWLTVRENVEAPLTARGFAADERKRRTLAMLETVGLEGFQGAYPKELSGGMRQRVGFARALVVEPEVLFMDEPFSALDVLTAENLRGELLALWQKKTIPTQAIFMVTHNIEEAVMLADRIIVLGRNPGRIRTDFSVELAHPRNRKSPGFDQLVGYIYKVLTQPEAQPPALPQTKDTETGARAPVYQMLPHARPGGVAGLLEMLQDHGGRHEVFRLADELSLEIDHLLPIVDAAQLLGFLTVEQGAAVITEAGRAYAQAEGLQQREIFRVAALERVLLIKQILSAVAAKNDHSVPEDFFHDMLDEQFSEDETIRQLETAVTWGRYAQLFDFDATRRRFVQLESALESKA